MAALQALSILETPPEDGYDALTCLAAEVCEAPMAVISLLDGERLWFKSVHGLDSRTIPRQDSFCDECIRARAVLHVEDAASDPRFEGCELVVGPLGVRFYAGSPIVFGGVAIGTIGVLDTRPRTLPANALRAFEQMAKIAAAMLRARAEAFRIFSRGAPGL